MLGQGQLLLIKNNPRRPLRPGNVGSRNEKIFVRDDSSYWQGQAQL
jgi:hypothetical protein